MRRSRFSEEQIIRILKDHQAGLSAAAICRRHCISDATFYKWRSKYGGMEVSDAKRLRGLEEENAKLKRLVADAMLGVSTLREMLGKTSNAQAKERGRDLGNERESVFAVPCLRSGRDRPAGLPLPVGQTGRYRTAATAARAGR